MKIELRAEYDADRNRVRLLVNDEKAMTLPVSVAVDVVGEEHAVTLAVVDWIQEVTAAGRAVRSVERRFR